MCDQEQELYYQAGLHEAEEERKGILAGEAAQKLEPGQKVWIQAEVTLVEWWEDDGCLLVKIDDVWNEIRIKNWAFLDANPKAGNL